MKTFFLLLASLLFTVNGAPSCDTGWVEYKDELCIKLFDTLETYDEAQNLCSSQGSEIAKSSLVMVKGADLQELLSNYTVSTVDNIWLGGKYDDETAQFKWEDGDPVIYSNWQEGYPSNTTESDNCIELRPTGSKVGNESDGKWADVLCLKRNLVMCQKTLSWSLQDAVEEIIRVRKEHGEQLSQLNDRVVPVGSIYVEYYNQPSPTTLWPSLSWEDITGTYAGLFFRALGGDSANWGSTQLECSPRITQMQYVENTKEEDHQYHYDIYVPANGWSDPLKTGFTNWPEYTYLTAFRLHTDGCEVRPKNQAIKIWKRTA